MSQGRREANNGIDPAFPRQLGSADPDVRLGALRRVCPCHNGFLAYEHLLAGVRRLKKDPDRRVHAAALHVERDACEIELIAARLDDAAERGRRYSDADWVRKKRRRQASRYWLPA